MTHKLPKLHIDKSKDPKQVESNEAVNIDKLANLMNEGFSKIVEMMSMAFQKAPKDEQIPNSNYSIPNAQKSLVITEAEMSTIKDNENWLTHPNYTISQTQNTEKMNENTKKL